MRASANNDRVAHLERSVGALEETMERQRRSSNLTLRHFPEADDEDPATLKTRIAALLSALGRVAGRHEDSCSHEVISVLRFGRVTPSSTRTRPLLVRFFSTTEATSALNLRIFIKSAAGSAVPSSCMLFPDLTKRQQDRKRAAMPAYIAAQNRPDVERCFFKFLYELWLKVIGKPAMEVVPGDSTWRSYLDLADTNPMEVDAQVPSST